MIIKSILNFIIIISITNMVRIIRGGISVRVNTGNTWSKMRNLSSDQRERRLTWQKENRAGSRQLRSNFPLTIGQKLNVLCAFNFGSVSRGFEEWKKTKVNHENHKRTIVQNMKFSIKEFIKCDQIRRKLRIWSHLLKKSIMENFIFREVDHERMFHKIQ